MSNGSEASTALDEAFEQIAFAGFELPNGFVNHGAMACEALAALGVEDELSKWARRFGGLGTAVAARTSTSFEWRQGLGDYRALPVWIGYFEGAIGEEGWSQVVGRWVPRLMPAMSTVLFHGMIRVAHAVRAIEAADSSARREELARALAYWAARYRRGASAPRPRQVEDVRGTIVAAAGEAARYYLAAPSIYHLHGITGAMALELLAKHLDSSAQSAAVAQLEAEHAVLYAGGRPVAAFQVSGVSGDELVASAEQSGDPHQVKLVEASLRALGASGGPVFAAAAETVTALAAEGAR